MVLTCCCPRKTEIKLFWGLCPNEKTGKVGKSWYQLISYVYLGSCCCTTTRSRLPCASFDLHWSVSRFWTEEKEKTRLFHEAIRAACFVKFCRLVPYCLHSITTSRCTSECRIQQLHNAGSNRLPDRRIDRFCKLPEPSSFAEGDRSWLL